MIGDDVRITRPLWWGVVRVKLISTRGETKMVAKETVPKSQVSKKYLKKQYFISLIFGLMYLNIFLWFFIWTINRYKINTPFSFFTTSLSFYVGNSVMCELSSRSTYYIWDLNIGTYFKKRCLFAVNMTHEFTKT